MFCIDQIQEEILENLMTFTETEQEVSSCLCHGCFLYQKYGIYFKGE